MTAVEEIASNLKMDTERVHFEQRCHAPFVPEIVGVDALGHCGTRSWFYTD